MDDEDVDGAEDEEEEGLGEDHQAPAAPGTPQPAAISPAPVAAPLDPVNPMRAAIESRARDLSLSGIVRPETLARKLRESIVEIVGPEAAVAYHIGAELKDGQIQFQIARLRPHLLAKFTSDLETAELAVAYRRTTSGGWRLGVGITASTNLDAPAGSELTASFAVTISR